MFINKKERLKLKEKYEEYKTKYEKIQNKFETLERENESLKNLNHQLAEEISAQCKSCHVGVWCKDCKHFMREYADYMKYDKVFNAWYKQEGDYVCYCGKHLHDLCPEHSTHEVSQEDNRME